MFPVVALLNKRISLKAQKHAAIMETTVNMCNNKILTHNQRYVMGGTSNCGRQHDSKRYKAMSDNSLMMGQRDKPHANIVRTRENARRENAQKE